MTTGEPALIAQALSGDHGSFLGLVRAYDDGLRALAFRLLGERHRDRLDDVLQEAYIKAYRGLGAFRGDAALGTWLYRIVYNTCLDELRRHRARVVVPLTEADRTPSRSPGPEAIAVGRSALAAALASLPVDQRAAVLLVDAEGLDYASAATVLGVAPGTVGSRVSRARAALRAALEQEERDAR